LHYEDEKKVDYITTYYIDDNVLEEDWNELD